MPTFFVNTSSSGGDGTTNGESGGTSAYASMSAFLSAHGTDTLSEALVVNCDSGSSNNADTTSFVFDGFTLDGNTIVVQANVSAGQEPNGIYNTGVYRIEVAGNIICRWDESSLTVIQIQHKNTRTGETQQKRGAFILASAADTILVDCISVLDVPTTNTASVGFQIVDNGTVRSGFVNCLAYDWDVGSGAGAFNVRANSSSPDQNFAYNCVAIDSTEGYRSQGGDALLKNCLSFGNTAAYANSGGADETNSTNNAGDDSAANITGVNSVDISSHAGTAIFVDYAGNDYHLDGVDAGSDALEGAGADLDADSYFAVTTDVDGDTRNATAPDIGFDEIVAAAPSVNVDSWYTIKENPVLEKIEVINY